MSLSNLSDSQNASKIESLLSESDNSVTKTDPIYDSSATEGSISSRPPQNTVIPEGQIPHNIPIVDMSDGDSPVKNDRNPDIVDESELDQEPDSGQNLPKVYHQFLNEVVRFSSRLLLREQDPIECRSLLENEDNLVGLQTLLGNMPPKTMDEVAMLKALRAREKKAKGTEQKTFASVEYTGTKQADTEAGNSSLQRKKQKVHNEGPQTSLNPKGLPASTTLPSLNKQGEANPVPSHADKWWCLFNDFEGAPNTDATSIFDCRFPTENIVEKYFNRKEDRARVNKVGLRSIGKKLQHEGAQTAFLGLCIDQGVGYMEKEMKALSLKNIELTEKLKLYEADIKSVEKLKSDLEACEKRNNELVAEKTTWDEKYSSMKKAYEDVESGRKTLGETNKTLERDIATLTVENKELIAGKGLIIAELEDAKSQVAMQHTARFDKVVSQLKFLYPDLKVDEVGAFKHVVDGKLVDIIVDEDEE
ncbi:hypothetical protein SESBI_16479 [Sesbania bispinosa]|nr:hypothetical protein SESBI_16479 [Sesbania bispinosa]